MSEFDSYSLDNWLYYLENKHQQEIQLGLTRIIDIAQHLNLNRFDAQVITVAGTNGKGSTVAAIESIYSTAGYRVASYTSPHLLVFNERIRINQQPISDQDLCRAFAFLEQARGGTALTYFEMTTLAAFWYFKQVPLDVIILEVGMGGRLDATNIVDADLSIITTVDLDHQEYLGNTKEEIGYEKAGILRANRPCIYADTTPPSTVLERVKQLNAELYCLGINYSLKTAESSLGIEINHYHEPLKNEELLDLPLPVINYKAAAAAILATYLLRSKLPVFHEHWYQAMRTIVMPGRQQVIKGRVTTVLDVAHNPQAVSLLVNFIKGYQPKKAVHAVFSALKDKNLCGLIEPMRSCVDYWYPAVLSGKRASSSALLLTALKNVLNIDLVCFEDPLAAYSQALKEAKPGDLIIVYGSFLMVSAVLAAEMSPIKQEELQ